MQICSMQMIISHMCMMVCDPCNIETDAFVNPFHTCLHILKLWSPNNDKHFIFPCNDMSSNTLNYFLLLPSIQQDPIAPYEQENLLVWGQWDQTLWVGLKFFLPPCLLKHKWSNFCKNEATLINKKWKHKTASWG